MFETWGRIIYRRRRLVLVLTLIVVAFAGVWGTGVFGSLQSAGGFNAPHSQSQRASDLAAAAFGRDTGDVVVLYKSATMTVADPAYRAAVTRTLGALPRSKVESAATFWSTGSRQFVSASGRETYAVLELTGGSDAARIKSFDAIRAKLAAPGLTEQAGGQIPAEGAINKEVTSDIGRAEGFSMPALLVLLLVIFGGLAAASLPLAIGGIAILGSFTALRLLTLFTAVSIYSVNITTILGLGLAIDYGLFMVSRFREELGRTDSVEDAVARTVATAGRTVAVSGITVAVALASLMLFPMTFLRSMGYGGVATVIVDMLAALTVLPALLALLGPRVNALRVRPRRRTRAARPGVAVQDGAALRPGLAVQPGGVAVRPGLAVRPGGALRPGGGERRGSSQDSPVLADETSGAWYRLARSVMRRPVVYVVVIVAGLAAVGSPFLHISWGGTDARVLPAGAAPRAVTEALNRDFPGNVTSPIEAVVQFPGPVSGAGRGTGLAAYVSRLEHVPGVTGGQVTGVRGRIARVDLRYSPGPMTSQARSIVGQVRDIEPPAGARVYVGGTTAELVDELSSLGATLPWMALVVVLATFVLLFLAFGSVVLPVKAIAANVLSLSATFGVVVWIFQDGHLSGLLQFTPTGTIDPTTPILMLAIIFGLSMDYEVFLLSRIRERYDVTGDNAAAVASGLQRTGGIITSAALLLVIVIGAFSASGISFIKLMGVGMIVALIVDATIVRILLVPATMRLLGRANWWVPRPLRRLYAQYGIREAETPVAVATAAEPVSEPAGA
jgi:trehalose monomycolate/heme transporter